MNSNLLKHIREIHLNKKPFKCDHEGCDKSYSHRQRLVDHINFDHLGLKKFHCDWCGSQFPQKASVVRHKKRACKFRGSMKEELSPPPLLS